jgi:hypothetical protein
MPDLDALAGELLDGCRLETDGESARLTGPSEKFHLALTVLYAAGYSVKLGDVSHPDPDSFSLVARPSEGALPGPDPGVR